MKRRAQSKSAVIDWHKPRCSWCLETIENITDAYAGWFEDDNLPYAARCHSPQVVHAGESGCQYYRKFPNGHLANSSVMDVPVSHIRRAPTEATAIALRRSHNSDPNQWQCWLSVVLGLTVPTWDHLSMMAAYGEIGTDAIDLVPLVRPKHDLKEPALVDAADLIREHSDKLQKAPIRHLEIVAVHTEYGGSYKSVLKRLVAHGDCQFDVTVNSLSIGFWIHVHDSAAPAHDDLRSACSVLFDAEELDPDGLPIPTGAPF